MKMRWILLAFFPASVLAQQDLAQPHRGERIEVTGTHIRRIDGETGLPIQLITRQDMERAGVQTAKDVLDLISAHLPVSNWNDARGLGDSSGSYTSASLRGLGADRTLILINGRRLAPYAVGSGSAIDMTAIPLAAIDRVEVLKDGASAIYGTDAVGGVINFVLRKDFSGLDANATGLLTQGGGAENWRINATAGYGDLARQGFNLFLNFDHLRQRALRAIDREFSRSSYLPHLSLDVTSAFSSPANIGQLSLDGRTLIFGLRNPGSCSPPLTLPTLNLPLACSFVTTQRADILPPAEKTTLFGRITATVDSGLTVFSEASWFHGAYQYRIQPAPAPIFSLSPSSRFYPGAYVASQNGDTSLPIDVFYRLLPLGNRIDEGITDQTRVIAGVQGTTKSWDYELAASHVANRATSSLADGYVSVNGFRSLLERDLIDPFGNHDEQTAQALRGIAVNGKISEGRASQVGLDFKLSGDVARLREGTLSLAAGFEGRRERLDVINEPVLISGDIIGIGGAQPGVRGASRRVASAFVEANAPVLKGFEVNVAARTDHYSDFGTTTNPKVTVRWEARPTLLVRASAGSGFRAPSLYDLFAPVLTRQVDGFEDFFRCPVTRLPADCAGSILLLTGGNPALAPERSRQANLGMVAEHGRSAVSIDYYRVKLSGRIGEPFPSPDRIQRGPPDAQFPELPGPALSFDLIRENAGSLETSGIDLDLRARTVGGAYGVFGFSLTGTYVLTYKADNTNEFPSGPGRSSFGGAVPRWRHRAAVDWSSGPLGATLGQTFQGGYTEPVNSSCLPECTVFRRVGTYSRVDFQLRYTGLARTKISLGVMNVADRDPPVSTQAGGWHVGFEPLSADPRGRSYYLTLGYSLR